MQPATRLILIGAAALVTGLAPSGVALAVNTDYCAQDQPVCIDLNNTSGNPKLTLEHDYLATLNGTYSAQLYLKEVAATNGLYAPSPMAQQVQIQYCPEANAPTYIDLLGYYCGGGPPASAYLNVTQYGEEHGNWCGPAAAKSILAYLGYGTSHDGEALSQFVLAGNGTQSRKYLETDYWGNTPWYVSQYDQPMPQSLNYWRTGNYNDYYIPDEKPDLNNLIEDLQYDLLNGWPLAPNTIEQKDAGYHLPGHPTNQVIGHWLTANGYYNSGYGTNIVDSATTVWSGVPPYYGVATDKLDSLLQQHGVAW